LTPQEFVKRCKAAAAEQQNHFTLASWEVVVMVPSSSQDQLYRLYQYALSAKHWKADDYRLEILRNEGVNLAFRKKLIEAQSISLRKGAIKFKVKRKRNQNLFTAEECHEVYNNTVSLDELDFS
jgi:hypothetical protein